MKKIVLGNEAIALGAIHAGISAAFAYPGTPSTEITEYLIEHQKELGFHAEWCSNEKTAFEAALGVSFSGKRALVSMKHVGLNVAMDAFVNSAISGVKGGLVIAIAGAGRYFVTGANQLIALMFVAGLGVVAEKTLLNPFLRKRKLFNAKFIPTLRACRFI